MKTWGPIVSAVALRRAVRTTLQDWLPSAVAETARQAGIAPATMPPVRSWHVVSLAQATEDQLPAVFVTTPGLADDPSRKGTGLYRAAWNLTVTVAGRAETYEATAELVAIYTAAVRTVCMQRATFGGFADATEWVGEDYDAIEDRSSRTLAAGFVDLVVTVADVLDAYGGPLTPPLDPLVDTGDWPIATKTRTTVVHAP